MARLIGPDEASRTVFLTSGSNKGKASAQGLSVPLYADLALSTPADVRSTTDQVIAGTPPTLTVDAYSQIPLFKFPAGVDIVYTSINGGPPVALYARTDERIDAVAAAVAGLGDAAQRSVGTTAGTVAAGNDSRIVGAAQKSANLSDVTNALTARTNLGLGGSAAGELDSLSRITTQHVTNSEGDEPGPVVCWTADDGYTSMIGYFDVLNAAGVKGTLFLTPEFVDKTPASGTWGPYITTAEVQQIIDAGHEIGSHGWNHEDFTAYLTANGADGLHDLIVQSKNDIEAMFPEVSVRTGAYCFGLYNSRIAEIVGRSHRYFRATRNIVVTDVADPHAVPSVDAFIYSEAQLKAFVDQAVATRGMVIFLVHGNMDAAHHTKIANVVAYAAAQGCQQKTFYDAMAERSAFKSNRHMVDTSGNSFSPAVRANRLRIEREDSLTAGWELDMDETTSAPFAQGVNGASPFEFRSGVQLGSSTSDNVSVGKRRIFWDAVTTSGSATLTSASAGFRANDVGATITGAGIPGGATILSVQSTTSVTLSDVATATATGVVITLGRVLAPPLRVSNDLQVYGPLQQHGNAMPNHAFYVNGTLSGSIDPTQWVRSGSGGAMLIDSGSGGSYVTIKAFGVKLVDQANANTVTILARANTPEASSAQPVGSIVSRANGDVTTGVVYVKESGAATNTGWSPVQTRTGVYVKEGTNGRQGVATLVAGTVTVANTSVTANSRIFLTTQSLGTVTTPKTVAVTARVVGTSFTITSEDATDTSVVAFQICEPG